MDSGTRVRLAELHEGMGEILDAGKANGDRLTELQKAEFDHLNEQCLLLEAETLKGELASSTPNPRIAGPGSEQPLPGWDGLLDDPYGQSASLTPASHGGRGRTFRELFPNTQLTSDGFASADDFYGAIHSGRHHPNLRPVESLGHTIGDPSTGGFVVPTQYEAALLDGAMEHSIVLSRADVHALEHAEKKIAGLDASSASGGTLYGGFSSRWEGEAVEATEDTTKSRQISLIAKKLFLFTQLSNELVADSGFGEMLGTAMQKALGWYMDFSFLQGSGAGQPLGVLNDPALVTVAKETGQAASTIVYSNLTKMFARLHPASVSNSVWVCNSTAIPQLLALSVSVGDGGSHIPVLGDAAGNFTMLTRPVLFTEKLPALGTTGDILLADLSQYAVGLRQGITLDRSQHLGFQTDETSYRGIVRVDGQGKWASAYTPRNGDTTSWCVSLATRA